MQSVSYVASGLKRLMQSVSYVASRPDRLEHFEVVDKLYTFNLVK